MTMLAYHNNPSIKEHYLARVRASRAADDIIRGTYGHSVNGHWRGCGVGCTTHDESGGHARYESDLGVPSILARLEDGIFESLPDSRFKSWPEEFLGAIPVGADMSLVWPRFAVWLLGDEQDGVIRFAKTARQRSAIQTVVDLYQRQLAGETVEVKTWRSAADAAAYATDAADAAAYAADAADAAAYADAADAAAYAARAAADAYAADDAGVQARVKQADRLLELMAAAPVAEQVMA